MVFPIYRHPAQDHTACASWFRLPTVCSLNSPLHLSGGKLEDGHDGRVESPSLQDSMKVVLMESHQENTALYSLGENPESGSETSRSCHL